MVGKCLGVKVGGTRMRNEIRSGRLARPTAGTEWHVAGVTVAPRGVVVRNLLMYQS